MVVAGRIAKKTAPAAPEQQQPEPSPQEIAKVPPPLAVENPLQAIMDVGGGLGGLDFPFDAFVAGTSMSDEPSQAPAPEPKQDVANPGQPRHPIWA